MGNVQQYVGKRVEVGRYQVEAVKYLGEGGSSFIFLVKDVQRESAKPMVLKRLVAENDAAFAWIQSEIDMHQRFRHPQIVEFIASQVTKKGRGEREVFILMEYCASGHLYENMTKMGEKRFTERDLLRLFRSLCVPVNVLHHCEPPIAHRDLKLENFLLAQNGVYKLCDFGSCVDGPQSLQSKSDRAREAEHVLKRTTAMYRSPELADVEGTAMFGAGELTETVDVWAMGCVLYTMAFFKPPFPPDGLRTERYTIPKESKYSADVHQLIARMLQADVERRATIDHVIECIDELLEGRPLPKSVGTAAKSPRKAAAPASKKPTTAAPAAPAPASRESSFGSSGSTSKTTEARKGSVPVTKPASDLLDMDFNPTISTPAPAAKAASSSTPAAPFSSGWTTDAPSAGFADFASFPTSPSKFGVPAQPAPAPTATLSPSSGSFDAFGFPASPVKQPTHQMHFPTQAVPPTQPMQSMQPAQPGFGFTSPPQQQAAPVDPFAGLGGLGGGAATAPGGYHQQQQQRMPQQGFQPMMMPQQQHHQQQQMWGQQPPHPHAQQQQQQQMWSQNNAPGAGFPRGF